MSRAVVVHHFGAPDSFALEQRTAPTPGPDEVAIQIHAAGVSFVDVLVAAPSGDTAGRIVLTMR